MMAPSDSGPGPVSVYTLLNLSRKTVEQGI